MGPEVNDHVSLQWSLYEQSQGSNLRPQREQTSWSQAFTTGPPPTTSRIHGEYHDIDQLLRIIAIKTVMPKSTRECSNATDHKLDVHMQSDLKQINLKFSPCINER
jgi:hypothetical protein